MFRKVKADLEHSLVQVDQYVQSGCTNNINPHFLAAVHQ